MTADFQRNISTFGQKMEEPFSEAWARFKEYQRDCPHHGFSKQSLLTFFYEGVELEYKRLMDAASNGDFLTQSEEGAYKLINNIAVSSDRQREENDRGHMTAENERDVNFINGQGFQQQQGLNQNQGFQPRPQGFYPPRWQNHGFQPRPQGFQQNFTQGFQSRPQTTNAFQPRQQPFIPAPAPFQPTTSGGSQDELKMMLQQFMLKSNEKFDSMYADLNGKFDSLSSHVKRLDLQATQDAKRVKQQQSVLPGRGETNLREEFIQDVMLRSGKTLEPIKHSTRLVIPPTAEVDYEPTVGQEENTATTETPLSTNEVQSILTMQYCAEDLVTAGLDGKGDKDSSPKLQEDEPTECIYNPPSGTPLLNTFQKRSAPGQVVVPCSFIGAPPNPPRRAPRIRIPRCPKVHPPDTHATMDQFPDFDSWTIKGKMMVAEKRHRPLLHAKFSGVEGEDPMVKNSQANRL